MAKDPEKVTNTSSQRRSFLQKPPEVHVIGGFAYETHFVTRRNARELMIRARPFEEEVGYDSIEAGDQIRQNIKPSKRGRQVEVVFVRVIDPKTKDLGEDIGVVTHKIIDIDFKGQHKRYLDVGVKSIKKDYRDKDIGTQLLLNVLFEHEGITDITGQSRNGRVFSYLEKLRSMGFTREIRGYDYPLEIEDLEELKEVISKSKFRRLSKLRTGLLENIYPEADPRLFEAPEGNEKAEGVVNKLKERGVQPGGSYGLRYRVPLIEDVINAARQDYQDTETTESRAAKTRYQEFLERIRQIGSFVRSPQFGKKISLFFW